MAFTVCGLISYKISFLYFSIFESGFIKIMTVMEETGTQPAIKLAARTNEHRPLFTRFITLLSSVRFGIIMLILLGLACLIGMLVMQQNMDGFENYYAQLTPSQQLLFGMLGFFDIYNSWYFNALLAILSINIILASYQRWPKAWAFISKPRTEATNRWLKTQKQNASFSQTGIKDEIINHLTEAAKKAGWRKVLVNSNNKRTVVFAESGAWNRLCAYAVHVGLLTIFSGGFLTNQFGYTGQLPLIPGQTANQIYQIVFELNQIKEVKKQLPFEVTCTDIQQKLINNDGAISAMNTLDWMTMVRIKDESGTYEGVVQMNKPLDYRGYRFFQASFSPIARARNITIRLKSENSGEVQDILIERNGTTALSDGTQIRFVDFKGNFSLTGGGQDEETSNYTNPAAILQVTQPNSTPQTVYAFGSQMTNIPIAQKTIAGFTYQLVKFEKVSDQHILSVQRDPGANVVYIGFTLLCLTLVAVFFFSHQRIWMAVEETAPNKFDITIGGNANRNQNTFDEKFKRFINNLCR
jgi:cytochrome c biogenesis protein